ncbi:Protein SnodProt1 [Pseudocercospora fuligena]|uniref:Protein SnodProt1 n=1 Tax=Pseudocercospora fuligena TaxID=685502 RepID=A0A8H6RP35_9PEZI|nr:Protein SnodProt1 [Pseudocercospora fuligena]
MECIGNDSTTTIRLCSYYKSSLFSTTSSILVTQQSSQSSTHLSLSAIDEINYKTDLLIIMQFITTIGALFTLAAAASAEAVSWDANYDDANRAMTSVSCSDGVNSLITKHGWQTQGAVPGFPNIGGAVDIAGWNSASCGQCFKVTYNGKSIHIVGIDRAGAGINMSKAAMNTLTNGNAEQFGRVDATIERVGSDQCGLTASKRTIEFNA